MILELFFSTLNLLHVECDEFFVLFFLVIYQAMFNLNQLFQSSEHLDYLEPKVKGVNRARVHPEVELRSFFEDLLVKIKEIPRVIL